MSALQNLTTDLDDRDVYLLKHLCARIWLEEDSAFPPRVKDFWHALAADLDEELSRRRVQNQQLHDAVNGGGEGRLVDPDVEP